MKTLFDPAAQKEIEERLEKLSPDSRPVWGKMTPSQMLAHAKSSMQVPVGDLKLKRSPIRFIGWMFKGMIRSDKPFSRNSPTAPEFVVRDQRDFAKEKAELLSVYRKLVAGDCIVCFEHGFFGKMSVEDWGYLMYKHMDHHLTQFGV